MVQYPTSAIDFVRVSNLSCTPTLVPLPAIPSLGPTTRLFRSLHHGITIMISDHLFQMLAGTSNNPRSSYIAKHPRSPRIPRLLLNSKSNSNSFSCSNNSRSRSRRAQPLQDLGGGMRINNPLQRLQLDHRVQLAGVVLIKCSGDICACVSYRVWVEGRLRLLASQSCTLIHNLCLFLISHHSSY